MVNIFHYAAVTTIAFNELKMQQYQECFLVTCHIWSVCVCMHMTWVEQTNLAYYNTLTSAL